MNATPLRRRPRPIIPAAPPPSILARDRRLPVFTPCGPIDADVAVAADVLLWDDNAVVARLLHVEGTSIERPRRNASAA